MCIRDSHDTVSLVFHCAMRGRPYNILFRRSFNAYSSLITIENGIVTEQ